MSENHSEAKRKLPTIEGRNGMSYEDHLKKAYGSKAKTLLNASRNIYHDLNFKYKNGVGFNGKKNP